MMSVIKSANGQSWTGLTHTGTVTHACTDVISCGLEAFSNMVALMTFSSPYMLFNLFLGIFYIIMIFAVVGLVLGGA